jgi:hypothetical protein
MLEVKEYLSAVNTAAKELVITTLFTFFSFIASSKIPLVP